MDMNVVSTNLEHASRILRKYGFEFWANKLDKVKSEVGIKSDDEVIGSIKRMYGGFGTLMDLAVDPHDLPMGVGEEEGNKELIGSINALHHSLRK